MPVPTDITEIKIPSFKVVASDEDASEVFAVSTVANPAIARAFVAFDAFDDSKRSMAYVSMAEHTKMRLTGPVLVPDMPILRHMPELGIGVNGYFNMVFSREVIETLAKKFARNGNLINTTADHSWPTDNYVFESWIVEDPERDKSAAMGFTDVAPGTWFVTMQVTDKQWWDEYITSGEFRGFSVEMMAGIDISTALSQVKDLNTELVAPEAGESEDEFIGRCIGKLVSEGYEQDQAAAVCYSYWDESRKSTKLQQDMTYTLKDGTAVEISALEVGGTVTVDGNPAPDGQHELEDGTVIEVLDGVIASVTEPESKEEDVEVEIEMNADRVAEIVNAALQPLVERIAALEGENSALRTELSSLASTETVESLRAELSAANEEIAGLKAEPSKSKLEGPTSKTSFKTAMERIQSMRKK